MKAGEEKETERKTVAKKRSRKQIEPTHIGSSEANVIDSIFSLAPKRENKQIKRKPRKNPVLKGAQKQNRSILEGEFAKTEKVWADDGLGGRFNKEGFTGRVEDGLKIYKAHVLNRPDAGGTKDCPFDCSCCFI